MAEGAAHSQSAVSGRQWRGRRRPADRRHGSSRCSADPSLAAGWYKSLAVERAQVGNDYSRCRVETGSEEGQRTGGRGPDGEAQLALGGSAGLRRRLREGALQLFHLLCGQPGHGWDWVRRSSCLQPKAMYRVHAQIMQVLYSVWGRVSTEWCCAELDGRSAFTETLGKHARNIF